jgi:toxin ParE1/3/4
MTLEISWGAEQDSSEAVSWYDEQREGLGAEFLDVLGRLLQRIEATPFQFPKIAGENEQRHLRHGVLRRFPYRVVFEVKDDHSLLVLAVAHTSRDPDYWRNRPTN